MVALARYGSYHLVALPLKDSPPVTTPHRLAGDHGHLAHTHMGTPLLTKTMRLAAVMEAMATLFSMFQAVLGVEFTADANTKQIAGVGQEFSTSPKAASVQRTMLRS